MLLSLFLLLLRVKVLSPPFKWLMGILGLFLITEIVTYLFWYNGKSNLPVLHVYTLLELILWTGFYRALFQDDKVFQRRSLIGLSLGSLFIILNTIFWEDLYSFNSQAKTLVQIFLVTYAVIYFFNAFGKTDFSEPIHQANSLLNFAVILYYSGSLFIFMFSNVLFEQGSKLHDGFWLFNGILFAVFQALICFSVWKVVFRKQKYISSSP
ncbi:MAG: hypothetical protein AAFR61_12460 [Bacteroidota bacterium]